MNVPLFFLILQVGLLIAKSPMTSVLAQLVKRDMKIQFPKFLKSSEYAQLLSEMQDEVSLVNLTIEEVF